MANIYEPEFQPVAQPRGFRAKRARLGYELGTERLGASLWEVPPGEAAYPYHFHYLDEELVVVISGRPTLRTPDGERQLEPGEAVRFASGEAGAHQILNRGNEPAVFLAVASQDRADVVAYPDSGKIGFAERLPSEDGMRAYFRRADAVDYYDEPEAG